MSIFRGLSGILGTFLIPDPDREPVIEEINFADAITAHHHWKTRLQDYVEGRSQEEPDPDIVSRDDQCLLGKWIHGPGLERYHQEPKFYQLRTAHAQFHFIAGKMVRHVQANERDQAQALLENEYKHTSRNVVQALAELNAHISGSS